MKLKLMVVDLELTARQKRVAAIGIALGVSLGVAALANAGVVHTFAPQETLTAKNLNDTLKALDDRVTGLQGSYVEQSSSVTTSGDGVWVDVPGLSTTFNAPSGGTATVDITAAVDVTAGSLENPPVATRTNCALQILLDGTPAGGGGSTQVASPYADTPFIGTLTAFDRLDVAAGPHTVKVQIEKPAGAYANTACVAGGATFFPRGRLRATVNAP